jgi:hypothetical protein
VGADPARIFRIAAGEKAYFGGVHIRQRRREDEAAQDSGLIPADFTRVQLLALISLCQRPGDPEKLPGWLTDSDIDNVTAEYGEAGSPAASTGTSTSTATGSGPQPGEGRSSR